MKQNRVAPRRRAPRTDAARRAQLLAANDRSGLSAADFARQQGVQMEATHWGCHSTGGQALAARIQKSRGCCGDFALPASLR